VSVALFAFGVAFVLYVAFGYPALLAALARFRTAPIAASPQWKTVSILLPVHNGAPWMEAKLRSILALDYPRELLQVVVISDGSGDRTGEIAREFAPQGVELVSLPRGGKAAALNEGIRRATGEILFFTDVRQELDPASLRSLVSSLADPKVGVVSGELVIRQGRTLEEANVGAYWRYEKWIRKHQSRIDSIMGATGCIYAMRASLAAPLDPDTILDDVVLPLGAFFQGYRLIFDEGARAYDDPTSLASEFRRKVRTLAGVYQTIGKVPQLLGPRNRMWIHFVSHKLGRLLLPWAMLLILAGSLGLPGLWRTLALSAQAAFYGLALLDLVAGARSPLKRITSPARTVFVLIAAAFCAVFYLLLPRQPLWQPTGSPQAGPSEGPGTEYHGHIVGLSQKDRRIFQTLKVIGRRRALWGIVTVFKVGVPEDQIESVIGRLQENMSKSLLFLPQEYYAHFYRGTELIVVFRNRVFRVNTDRGTWQEAVAYGKALGIAERQLDFAPCRVEDETY